MPNHALCPALSTASSIVVDMLWVSSSPGLDVCVCVWGRLTVGGLDVRVSCFALSGGGEGTGHPLPFLPCQGQPPVCLGTILHVAPRRVIARCSVVPTARMNAHLEGRLSPGGLICLSVCTADSSITAPWAAVQAASHPVKLHL